MDACVAPEAFPTVELIAWTQHSMVVKTVGNIQSLLLHL